MEHKYSRVNYQASKNYYQLMQMAYLINQLMVIIGSHNHFMMVIFCLVDLQFSCFFPR
jgi:hypothetical protein